MICLFHMTSWVHSFLPPSRPNSEIVTTHFTMNKKMSKPNPGPNFNNFQRFCYCFITDKDINDYNTFPFDCPREGGGVGIKNQVPCYFLIFR